MALDKAKVLYKTSSTSKSAIVSLVIYLSARLLCIPLVYL